MHIEINFPYSVSEIFNPNARARLSELRSEALELFGNKKNAWAFVCQPHALYSGKSLLELSQESTEGHEQAIYNINAIKHGLPV